MAIVLDAMGGDFAPKEIVEGARLAAREGIEIYLTGPLDVFHQHGLKGVPNLYLVDAPEIVSMSEAPAEALRKKPKSSISVGVRLAKEKGLPFVSAGNTGACMAAALFLFGRLPGIRRPPIASVFPQANGKSTVVLDVGANVDCDASNLHQFARMGTAWAKAMLGVDDPCVGLLSNGSEEEKGNALIHEVYPLLKADSGLNFIGNVEGFDALSGRADVIVTDGFSGNILLKALEGMAHVFKDTMKSCLPKDSVPSGEFMSLMQKMRAFDPSSPAHCGAPLLGVDGYCYIVHGNATQKIILGACQTSEKLGQSGLLDLIRVSAQR